MITDRDDKGGSRFQPPGCRTSDDKLTKPSAAVTKAPSLVSKCIWPDRDSNHSVINPNGICSSEKISFKNIIEATKLGMKCFPLPTDRAVLLSTYAAYASGLLRILPEPVLGGWAKLDLYQLYRDGEGKAIAISGLYRSPLKKDTLWLGWLGVTPELQGAGIGTQLVRQLEKTALERGAKMLKVYMDASDKPLFRFYQKLGFVQEGEDKKTKLSGTVKILKKDLS